MTRTPEARVQPVDFLCHAQTLSGMFHPGAGNAEIGVVIVVGGPQTRVGAHRQFVLLARALAAAGYPCLRFDYRGMGDSEGEPRNFLEVQDDIHAAIDCLYAQAPSLKKVALWGLCDGASAAVFYAPGDPRVAGLALLNPWIRTEAGAAAALLSDYYGRRIFSPDFWKKILSGRVNLLARIREFIMNLATAKQTNKTNPSSSLPERFAQGLIGFKGRVLLVLSGNDLTAAEFRSALSAPPLEAAIENSLLAHIELAEANHTFSSAEWRGKVEQATLEWLSTLSM
ncbi:MAG: hydrolase 1, exosortase A system-associated [Betaproteobacteria bacterium]|nr:hydrolase 1, exosortase A system-associated [Betaproteobacteria bacterium]